MISWITENVAIGEDTDSVNEWLLKKEKIDCILNVQSRERSRIIEDSNELFLGINHYHVSVGRHQGLEPIKIELRTAAYMLDLLSKKYKRILVHCTAGIDRAPFVVAYYLATTEVEYQDDYVMSRLDLKFWITRAYKFIKEKRSQVIEHMEWI